MNTLNCKRVEPVRILFLAICLIEMVQSAPKWAIKSLFNRDHESFESLHNQTFNPQSKLIPVRLLRLPSNSNNILKQLILLRPISSSALPSFYNRPVMAALKAPNVSMHQDPTMIKPHQSLPMDPKWWTRNSPATQFIDSWCSTALESVLRPLCRCGGHSHNRAILCNSTDQPKLLQRTLFSAAILLQNEATTQLDHLQLFNCSLSDPNALGWILPSSLTFRDIRFHKTRLRSISKDLKFLHSNPNRLQSLSLAHNEIPTFPFQSACARLLHLQRLVLRYNHLRSIPEHALQHCQSLTHLDLSFNRLSHIGAYAFSDAPRLRVLQMRANQLKVINNFAFASHDSTTGAATLAATRWMSKHWEQMAVKSALQNRPLPIPLSHYQSVFGSSWRNRSKSKADTGNVESEYIHLLDLSANQIRHIADGAFDQLRARVLDLSQNQLKHIEHKHFAAILDRMYELENESGLSRKLNTEIDQIVNQIQQNAFQQLMSPTDDSNDSIKQFKVKLQSMQMPPPFKSLSETIDDDSKLEHDDRSWIIERPDQSASDRQNSIVLVELNQSNEDHDDIEDDSIRRWNQPTYRQFRQGKQIETGPIGFDPSFESIAHLNVAGSQFFFRFSSCT